MTNKKRTESDKGTRAVTAPSKGTPQVAAPVATVASDFAGEGLDEKSGAAALARVHSLVSSLLVTPATAPKLNQQAAASTTIAMLSAISDLRLGPRLQKLATDGELDPLSLGRLPDLARAAWYLRHQLDRSAALGSEAKIPESLHVKAQDLRSRMLQLLDFVLAADAQVVAELTMIRQGSGYQDLAADLVALGTLYQHHRAMLMSAAPLHYRDSDAQDAPKVAAQIVAELGKSLSDKGDRSLPLLLAQVTTQLAADFEEVAAAARFLTRKQPTEAARFPNLFLASKRTRAPRPEPTLDSDHQPQPPTG
jgi:hypothetical protein